MNTKKQSARQLYKKLSYGYHKEVFSYCDEMGFEKKVLQNSLGNIVDTCYKIGKSFLVIRLENDEPSLMMAVNLLAKEIGMQVVQSTTERKTTETIQSDGTSIKTQIFSHVIWREILK